jgi:hypothetical protein
MQDLGIFLASRCTGVRTRRVLTDARFSSCGPFKRVSLGYRYCDLTLGFEMLNHGLKRFEQFLRHAPKMP